MLRIGQLSLESGVSIKTIRYYEELGLIQSPERTEGQFRLFTPDTVHRLLFVKRLQSLGLSLQQICECLVIHDQGELNLDSGRPLSFDDAESIGFGEQSIEFGGSLVFPENSNLGGELIAMVILLSASIRRWEVELIVMIRILMWEIYL
jgi:DNA-binding transcriptional MerR regulator